MCLCSIKVYHSQEDTLVKSPQKLGRQNMEVYGFIWLTGMIVLRGSKIHEAVHYPGCQANPSKQQTNTSTGPLHRRYSFLYRRISLACIEFHAQTAGEVGLSPLIVHRAEYLQELASIMPECPLNAHA